ncbi:ABC transporter ATP-binding protein [Paenibacillus hexagrammi]|uniref:Wzt carbohydrate-binding domain-containing protein n=1 Tax=Paenibacillus hexagrammi TaxID=2908839 RepID=A0ABY3SKN0_9BACL|nr:Wzt carbohydrate-binding domain-containing protein [Paenibacillus sp. YPD9-1]UJF34264.1 Wzt carbohydrate-binding domain-containing protein [Paenibacillus sp. YPD9-1]
MQSRLKEIIEFADLGDFINQPVKTYSSGMYARLAFSVAINIDPDLLIVDEALSVGDMGFQHKCMNKMRDLIEKGVTVIFVSHDTFAVKSLCSRCIYLEHGKIKADGNAITVTDKYLMDIRTKIYKAEAEEIITMNQTASQNVQTVNSNIDKDDQSDESVANSFDDNRYGTGDVRIQKVMMTNEQGIEADHFEFGEIMNIEIYLESYKDINDLNCCIRIRDKNGIDITGLTTFEEKLVFPMIKEGDKLRVCFSAPNFLKHDMTFSIGVTINDTKSIADLTILDHVDLAYTFKSTYNPERPVWYMYYQKFDIKYEIQ